MFISIMFKDKYGVFKGKEYDYKLCSNEQQPIVGSIVRLMDKNYDFIHYGTRVLVTAVKSFSNTAKVEVRCLETTLDD